MSLVNLASRYYRTTISIFLFVIFSGSLVFNSIPKESYPDINLPYIYVSLGLTGISPEDSEKLLIKPGWKAGGTKLINGDPKNVWVIKNQIRS